MTSKFNLYGKAPLPRVWRRRKRGAGSPKRAPALADAPPSKATWLSVVLGGTLILLVLTRLGLRESPQDWAAATPAGDSRPTDEGDAENGYSVGGTTEEAP